MLHISLGCTREQAPRKSQRKPRGSGGGHVAVVERRVPNCTVPAVAVSGSKNEQTKLIRTAPKQEDASKAWWWCAPEQDDEASPKTEVDAKERSLNNEPGVRKTCNGL